MARANKAPRWHQANVVLLRGQTKELWQFAVGDQFNLAHHESFTDPAVLPAQRVKKSWQALFQKQLNIAWVPTEMVFLKALQLPSSDPAEIRSMTELQLEKISPIPVARVVWSVVAIGPMVNNLQSVVVLILPREEVEACLGRLEKDGYMADRLESPILDQLLATDLREDGVWVFPDPETPGRCLSLWWFQGVLRHVSIHACVAGPDLGEQLRDQMTRIAWAGELDGWLPPAPQWKLVAEAADASEWEAVLRPLTPLPVKISAPVGTTPLAGLTARRVVAGKNPADLLPPEYLTRYQQQFVDQFWMQGLAAALVIYLFGLLVYFSAVGVLWVQNYRLGSQYTPLEGSYTNALKMGERVQMLEQQSHLKFAALDCWKLAVEALPKEMSLTSFSLAKGRKLSLFGVVPQDSSEKVYDYNLALSKGVINGEPVTADPPTLQPPRADASGAMVRIWSLSCRLGKGGPND
jgi:hypothetical protein